MQQRFGLAIAALLAVAIAHWSSAVMAQGGRPEVKQIQLTEKQVQGFCTSPQWVEKGKAPWSVRMCSPMFKHE